MIIISIDLIEIIGKSRFVGIIMNATELEQWLSLVRNQIRSLDYGVVQIVVHDSRVVQIERTEKFRLEKLTPSTSLQEKAHQITGG